MTSLVRRLLSRLAAPFRGLGGVRLPADTSVGLLADERVIGWGRTTAGAVVAATTWGVRVAPVRGKASQQEPAALPWHEIHTATWRDGVLTLLPGVEVEPDVLADGEPITLALAEPRDLPANVRARVTRSIAYSAHHQLPGGGGVWVVARHRSGEDGLGGCCAVILVLN